MPQTSLKSVSKLSRILQVRRVIKKYRLRAMFDNLNLPLMARVLEALGGWLSDMAGAELSLRPDLDQVPALNRERDDQWRRVAEATFLTDTEKRAMLGLPRLSEEDL